MERASIRVNKVIKIAEEENNQVLEEHRDLFNGKAITTRSQRHIDMKDVIGNKFCVTVRLNLDVASVSHSCQVKFNQSIKSMINPSYIRHLNPTVKFLSNSTQVYDVLLDYSTQVQLGLKRRIYVESNQIHRGPGP